VAARSIINTRVAATGGHGGPPLQLPLKLALPFAKLLARPMRWLYLKSQDPLLETVSTTCGSGWVRSCAATELLNTFVKAAHPPATAGGTDCLQRNFRLL